jgi:hypothetical protein
MDNFILGASIVAFIICLVAFILNALSGNVALMMIMVICMVMNAVTALNIINN